ncbi:MAG: hypothetical protein JWO38_2859 [Gemmataceae bacterium]|nr:hypothetical protein [Gemmataceae bacterium]
MLSRWVLPAIVVGLMLASPYPAAACPFCSATGETLAGEVSQADFILYGTLSNAKRDATDPNAFNKGTTDLTIDLVIKDHEMVKGKKVVTIPKFLPPDPKTPNLKHLVFFKLYAGQLDAYRGEGVAADSKLPEYLKGAIEARPKDAATRLTYFFSYLESPDLVISGDAYSEFGYADYKEIRALTDKWKADPTKAQLLLGWLKDPNTRPTRYGLYGLLLGNCGKPEDAKALRALLDDPNRSYTSGLDGVLAGYVLLDPKAGWEYLLGIVGDPKKDFSVRYAGLRTIRFFWESRTDVVPGKQVLDAMKVLIDQSDLADLPIEDLRKWKTWELTPFVLGYAAKESHSTTPIVARSILKFALAAAAADPKNAGAVEFVKRAREKDPKKVEFLESLLRDEQRPPLPSKTTDK